jgi:sigma-B regulation protein RsbU (phosphoserine phosphatase)
VVQEQPALGPSEVFRAVNRALMENISRLDASRYMTLNLVKVEPEALVVTGKHQDILVWRAAERRVEVVENDGAWLGVSRDLDGELNDHRIPMSQGDVALFFTDGVVEATSASGAMFGEERLATALTRAVTLTPAQAVEALFAEVMAYQPRQDDDVTMMLVKREE